MTDLHWLTASEISARFAAGTLSPVELVAALLNRIDALDGALNAFIRLDRDAMIASARNAEAEIRRGGVRTSLHGIPVGIKDVIDVAGVPTTCHSKILLGHLAERDADAVANLRAAGAIPFGKLATHEFALGGPSFDLPFPPARNPWNRAHHPGGSSSGAGVAVAAGFVPIAIGTDTAGSIRNPAGACGIVGLKPTYDLVSRKGVFPLAFSLDHIGPLTRSVRDAALALDALAPASSRSSYGAAIESGARGLRVGVVRHFHERDMPAEAEVGAAVEAAAAAFADDGASVGTATLPDLKLFSTVNRTILQAEAWSIHANWLRTRPQDYGEATRRRLLPGAFLSAEDLLMAQRLRTTLIAAVEDALRDFDVLLTANSMDAPCRIDDAVALKRTYPRQARAPFNITGHPAIAVPASVSQGGLPVAVQLVGRAFDEATLLQAAAAFERRSGMSGRHPRIETVAASLD